MSDEDDKQPELTSLFKRPRPVTARDLKPPKHQQPSLRLKTGVIDTSQLIVWREGFPYRPDGSLIPWTFKRPMWCDNPIRLRKKESILPENTYAHSQHYGGLYEPGKFALDTIAHFATALPAKDFALLYDLMRDAPIDWIANGERIRKLLRRVSYKLCGDVHESTKDMTTHLTATQIREQYGSHWTNFAIQKAMDKGIFPKPKRLAGDNNNCKSKRLWNASAVERAIALL